MTITRLELSDFTVFKQAKFAFCPGINVLIGENGTGKTHVLKAMYAAYRAMHRWDGNLRLCWEILDHKFQTVFRLVDGNFRPLIRRGGKKCRVEISNDTKGTVALEISRGKIYYLLSNRLNPRHSIFFPPREVLAMYRGFVAAYEGRELDFDETYYDLCKALSAAPLRGERARAVQPMLAPLETILGGKVVLEGVEAPDVKPAAAKKAPAKSTPAKKAAARPRAKKAPAKKAAKKGVRA